MRCRISHIVAVAFLLTVAGASFAQPTPNPATIVVRAYNIADLLRTGNDYPLPAKKPEPVQVFNPDGTVKVQAAPKPTGPETSPITAMITNVIDPSTWTDSDAKISVLGTTLVVRQTVDVQTKIQQLLDGIRMANGPAQILTVRTTWVACAARELPDTKTEVSLDWINKQKTYCESQITCFSGQTVHIRTGKTRPTVSDLTPVVANSAVAFDPTVTNLLSGVELQLSPQMIPGSDQAILDVQCTVSEVQPPEPQIVVSGITQAQAGPGAPSQTIANVDRIGVLSQEFKTTARLPLRKYTIIGGMTLEPAGAEKEGGKQLYLVVDVDVAK